MNGEKRIMRISVPASSPKQVNSTKQRVDFGLFFFNAALKFPESSAFYMNCSFISQFQRVSDITQRFEFLFYSIYGLWILSSAVWVD